MALLPVTLDAQSEVSQQPPGSTSSFIHGRGYWIGVDTENRIIKVWFISPIMGGVTPYLKLITMIMALTEDHTLHFYIHSPGGEISTCCNIINALEKTRAQVVIHVLGLAASCGSLMLVAADKIHIGPNAITMFHSAGIGLGGLVHRVVTRTRHTIAYVSRLFETMKDKGLLTQEEHEAITKRGEEFFITSDEMERRLRVKGIWYEGGNNDA